MATRGDESRFGKAPKSCVCETCKKKKGLPNRVGPEEIHGYQSRPSGGWRAKGRTGPGRYSPTFGVELETSVQEDYQMVPPYRVPRPTEPVYPQTSDRYGNPIVGAMDEWERLYSEYRQAQREWNRAEAAWRASEHERLYGGILSAEEAVSVAEPRDLWHAKHDGSVSGPEFASQPATLAYWHDVQPALEDMFRALLHGGVRSHDGDTAGLHVNIGSDAFADAGHLWRLSRLLHRNERWAVRMSQRTLDSAGEWARFDELAADGDAARWAADWKRDGAASQNRYAVLNASNAGRVEFRLPRGTLRIDRFYAKLEWTAAMVEYTRSEYNALTSASFMAWVRNEQSDTYPALVVFLAEKFPAATEYVRLDEAIVMPEPTRSRYDECNNCGFARYRTTYNAGCGGFHQDGGFAAPAECPCGDGCPMDDCPACDGDPLDDLPEVTYEAEMEPVFYATPTAEYADPHPITPEEMAALVEQLNSTAMASAYWTATYATTTAEPQGSESE